MLINETGETTYQKVCAPMVRYSKLAFRRLVRKYNCELCFTPMIVAECFIKSQKARDSDLTTNAEDLPLVVQFAARNATELATAAEYVVKTASGIDLNCGCPQKWAVADGFGCCLLSNPELISDMVKQTRARISNSNDFSISIKIRVDEDARRTVELCRQAEAAGVDWISVHARTAAERHQPVRSHMFAVVKDSVSVPVIANGDVTSLRQANQLVAASGVDGVMIARGLLHNPALYAGYDCTPLTAVKDWIELSLETGIPFTCFHHHLQFMLDRHLSRAERALFNRLNSVPAVIDYLNREFLLFNYDSDK